MRRLVPASAPAAVAPWSPPSWGLVASAGRSGEAAAPASVAPASVAPASVALDAAGATGHPRVAAWLARAAGVLVAADLAGAGAVSSALRRVGGSGRGEATPRGDAPRPTSPGLAALLRSRRVRRLMHEGATG